MLLAGSAHAAPSRDSKVCGGLIRLGNGESITQEEPSVGSQLAATNSPVSHPVSSEIIGVHWSYLAGSGQMENQEAQQFTLELEGHGNQL